MTQNGCKRRANSSTTATTAPQYLRYGQLDIRLSCLFEDRQTDRQSVSSGSFTRQGYNHRWGVWKPTVAGQTHTDWYYYG